MNDSLANEDAENAKSWHYNLTNGRPPSAKPSTKMIRWLSDCNTYHESCRMKALDPVEQWPTRILHFSGADVSATGDPKVRLQNSVNVNAKDGYVALSYRWGSDNSQYKTTTKNFNSHCEAIEFERLPKTIQCAIRICRRLKFKYLWVDALCILQDSKEDQKVEISRMSSVYRNASLTIVAASTSDCNDSFLQTRREVEKAFNETFYIDIKIPLAPRPWGPKWIVQKLWLAKEQGDKNDLCTTPFDEEGISTRGWTLQEALLSRRLLVFGSRQTWWSCATSTACDGGFLAQDRPFAMEMSLLNSIRTQDTEERRDEIERFWQNVVRDFTGRDLTYPTDKMNAIDGIAQEIRRQSSDQYIYGLWLQRLINGLAWYQSPIRQGRNGFSLCNTRSKPTWSWAKTDGPVTYVVITHLSTNVLEVVEDGKGIRLRGPMISQGHGHEFVVWKETSRAIPRYDVSYICPDGGLSNPDFSDSTKLAKLAFLELARDSAGYNAWGLVLVKSLYFDTTFRRTGFYKLKLVVSSLEAQVPPGTFGPIFSLDAIRNSELRKTSAGSWWDGHASIRELVLL